MVADLWNDKYEWGEAEFRLEIFNLSSVGKKQSKTQSFFFVCCATVALELY